MKKKSSGKKKKFPKAEDKMKAQIFSMDTIIGVVIFLVIFAIFFGVLSKNMQRDQKEALNEEARVIVNRLTQQDLNPGGQKDISIIKDGVLMETDLIDFANKNYSEIKALLGVKGDFCIFFEDSQGNVMNLSNLTAIQTLGFGSDEIFISGFPCKTGNKSLSDG